MEEGPVVSMTLPLPDLSHMMTQENAANIGPHHLRDLAAAFVTWTAATS